MQNKYIKTYAKCVQDVLYLRQLLRELDIGACLNDASVVYVDNRTAKACAEMESTSTKMRHVDIKYHFVRDHVDKKDVRVDWIQSADNVSDIFTKPLASRLFDIHASRITVKI